MAEPTGEARRQPGLKENGSGRTVSALMYVKTYCQWWSTNQELVIWLFMDAEFKNYSLVEGSGHLWSPDGKTKMKITSSINISLQPTEN